jgi:RimJ/RimL family protein N-acetyltransferase
VIETERLRLRLPRLEDAEAFAALLGDPETMRFLGGETVPPEAVPGVVQRWIDDWDTFPAGKFVLERRDDRTILGRVGLNFFDPATWERTTAPQAQPELGWALLREHWGRGYATEAARAVRDAARCERLVSLVAPANVRSGRVAERLGARPTETVVLFDGSEAVVWVHP